MPVLDLTKQTRLDNYFKKQKMHEGAEAIVTIDPNIISDENDSDVEEMSEDSDANAKDNSLDELTHFVQMQNNALSSSQTNNSQEKRSSPPIGKSKPVNQVPRSPSPPIRPEKKSIETPMERYPHNERIRADIDNDPIISSDSDEEPVPKKGLWKVKAGDARRRSIEHESRVRLGDIDSKRDDEFPSLFGKFAMKGRKTQAPVRGLNGWPSPKKTSPTKAESERERERRKEREREREKDMERLYVDSSHDSEVKIVTAPKAKPKEAMKRENCSPIKSISQLDLSCLLSEDKDWETPSQLITHLEYEAPLDSTAAKGKSHARAQGKPPVFSPPTSHLFPSPRPDSISEGDEDIVVLHATSGKNGMRPHLKSEPGAKPKGRKRTTRIDDYYSSQPASASNQAPSDEEEAREEMKDFIVADDEDLSLVDSTDERSDSDSERIARPSRKKRKKRRKSHQHSLDEEDKQFMSKIKVSGTLKEHFGTYLQFIFSFCLDPEAFDRPFARSQDGDTTDEYFNRSIKRVHDAIAMKKNSLVQSNAWDAEFKLERLPSFKTSQGLGHGDGHCMACNRSHSTATVAVVLEGRPYNSKKFWDGDMLLDKDDHSLVYHLGRHCCKRSELYHKLHHYQYKLVKFCQSKIKRLKSESHVTEPSEILLQALGEYQGQCYDEFKALSNEADAYLEEAV